MKLRLRVCLVGTAALLSLGPAAQAHDTWFERLPASPESSTSLALGTGNRFPVADVAVDTRHFVRSGCFGPRGGAGRLDLVRYDPATTVLRVEGATLATCFAQLDPFEIELPPDKVTLYFRETRPSPAVLRAWTDLHSRGEPFRERYTKSARIELDAAGAAVPVGTVMDVVRSAPEGAVAVGTEAQFQVLRDGKPLADFPVELINERSPVGLWQRTDVEGRVRARLPLPGRWLLRGTDLRVAANEPVRFESWFVTYAFEVR